MSTELPSVGCRLLAEFATAEDLLRAVRALEAAGFRHGEAYGPAPLAELDELVPARRGRGITAVMACGALLGACFGYFIQYWGSVLGYPLNVGGRPFNGWPGFVPAAWEICALFTVYAGLFAFLAFCRLPRLHHPVFLIEQFARASQDRFFVLIESHAEPRSLEHAYRLLHEHRALSTAELAA